MNEASFPSLGAALGSPNRTVGGRRNKRVQLYSPQPSSKLVLQNPTKAAQGDLNLGLITKMNPVQATALFSGTTGERAMTGSTEVVIVKTVDSDMDSAVEYFHPCSKDQLELVQMMKRDGGHGRGQR